MKWRLFLDDERFPVQEEEWIIARNHNDATYLIIKHGLPCFISFDHDLGDGPDGAAFVDWLINHMLDNGLRFPAVFSYLIHSQNPIGAANIRGKMDQALLLIGKDNAVF